jgi:hypothetical protein
VCSRAFYEGVLGLEPIYSDNRLSAYVLLIFRKGTTGQTVTLHLFLSPGCGIVEGIVSDEQKHEIVEPT